MLFGQCLVRNEAIFTVYEIGDRAQQITLNCKHLSFLCTETTSYKQSIYEI